MECHSSCHCPPAKPDVGRPRIALISPYDLGRQPFALAEAGAQLADAGYQPVYVDLSQQRLADGGLGDVAVVLVHLGMHTATRIALEALPRIRALAPGVPVGMFGWYAPVNDQWLREQGVDAVFGGESDQDLVDYVHATLAGGDHPARHAALVNLERIGFAVPLRAGLPGLDRYAHLVLPDGSRKVMGFTESTRGCKHRCRHCPVVPVYDGRFRALPVAVVLADIDQQVDAGAQHISFGDPDFLNGPGHARRIVRALHERHPELTWDAVIKVEHLRRHADMLDELRDSGCLLVTTAVEAVDDHVLERLDKGHTAADFVAVVAAMRRHGIALAPTFVPFTPWTSLAGYRQLLDTLVELQLVSSVNPVQLALRLLIPQGSRLLELPRDETCITGYNPAALGYDWRHPDPRVDALQREVMSWVESADRDGLERLAIFNGIRERAHAALGETCSPIGTEVLGTMVPAHSESWYCCAEPTGQQLADF